MNMPRLPKSMRSGRILLTFCGTLIMVGTLLSASIIFSPVRMMRGKYVSNIHKLSTTTTQIKQSLNDDTLTLASIAAYRAKAASLGDTCGRLQELGSDVAAKKSLVELRDKSNQTVLLCKDLSPVAQYTTDVYSALSDYLLYTPSKQSSPADQSESLALLASNTLTAFSQISNKINDPAYDEIKTLLQREADLASDADTSTQQTLPDAEEKRTIAQNGIATQQAELWQRRRYFWNNTIQIDRLYSALRGQEKMWRQ